MNSPYQEYLYLIKQTLLWIEEELPPFSKKLNSPFADTAFTPPKSLSPSKEPSSLILKKEPSTCIPPPSPPQETKKEEPEKKASFSTLPFSIKERVFAFSEIEAFFEKNFPSFERSSQIPSDELAKKLARSYLYKNQASEITILGFDISEKYHLFLENVAKAIELHFFPCSILWELKSIDWHSFLQIDTLKLVILCETTLKQNKELLSLIRKDLQGRYFLKHLPLFLLSDVSLYVKDPSLKKALWKNLCHQLTQLN